MASRSRGTHRTQDLPQKGGPCSRVTTVPFVPKKPQGFCTGPPHRSAGSLLLEIPQPRPSPLPAEVTICHPQGTIRKIS